LAKRSKREREREREREKREERKPRTKRGTFVGVRNVDNVLLSTSFPKFGSNERESVLLFPQLFRVYWKFCS
jgi:hypothetical protein